MRSMDEPEDKPRSTGRFLGLPYDWRRPDRQRVKSRSWNSEDRRLFPPKSFGWGFGLNFYELFRRIGLVTLARRIRGR